MEHIYTKIVYAIKQIRKTVIERTFGVNEEQFVELEVLQLLTRSGTPNVLSALDSFESEDEIFIVTKYMPGGDLLSYLCTLDVQPLDEKKAKKIVRQLVTGLKAMHDKNIMHRDIKLNNILVSDGRKGEVDDRKFYLADMGSAAILPTKDAKCTFRICTAGYTAPEMLQAQPYGLPYDIWSLGALVYLLLIAKLPFWE